MGLDAASGKMNEQAGHEYLGSRDGVAREFLAWPKQREGHRKESNDPSEKYCGPNMNMGMAIRTRPSSRRYHESRNDARDPLEQHESGKEAISTFVDRLLTFLEKRLGPRYDRFGYRGFYLSIAFHFQSPFSFPVLASCKEQPKTDVSRTSEVPAVTSEAIAVPARVVP
jgi:hypothetical protein